jgi:hypothetical protein
MRFECALLYRAKEALLVPARGFRSSAVALGGRRPGRSPSMNPHVANACIVLSAMIHALRKSCNAAFNWKQRKQLGVDYKGYAKELAASRNKALDFNGENIDMTGFVDITDEENVQITTLVTPEEKLQQWKNARKKVKVSNLQHILCRTHNEL